MEHQTVAANGASFHVARAGKGAPLLLLHGWPEFSLAWAPVMQLLADRYSLVAPDLRGFGDSDKPAGPFGPEGHAADMLALIDALGIERIGAVGHDVGGPVLQAFARRAPERLTRSSRGVLELTGVASNRLHAGPRSLAIMSGFPPRGSAVTLPAHRKVFP